MSRVYPIRFGRAGDYKLSELALKHILVGNTVVRPISVNGVRTTEVVLSGGLHTWDGWESLLQHHASIVHLLEYDVDRHDDWFYARELQNGVITLKIPRKMFTGDAASITMQPDLHYKSGYLWKTLYPMGVSEDDVIKLLAEAFDNLDREDSQHPVTESSAGVLYGYTLLDDPFKAMKLRIQVRGSQIQSAFPAWEQPMTGNNGKPYSHWHSINFTIAESTVNHERYAKAWGRVFPERGFSMAELLRLTPDFILRRPRRNLADGIDKWREVREVELMKIAPLMKHAELQRIEEYLSDYICCKDPFGLQMFLYNSISTEIDRDDHIFNAVQLLENVAECIQVLTHSDLEHRTRRVMSAMTRFLRMAIVHTGGLCSLMFKRVIGEFIEAAVGHHHEGAIRELFSALAASPCRAALYTEFDLSPFVRKNDTEGLRTPGYLKVEMELTAEHLYEFIALNLGENYLQILSKDERLAIARGFFPKSEQKKMVSDAMSFLSGIDFQFFMPIRFIPEFFRGKSPPNEDDLIAITRDYSRMLLLYRQRIVLEDPAAYKALPDLNQAGTNELFELVCQKNKRLFVLKMHEYMLEKIVNYAGDISYSRLKVKAEEMLVRLPKEAVPLAKPIPDYIIVSGRETKSATDDIDDLVRVIMGAGSSA